MTEKLQKAWKELKEIHKKHLQKAGVKLPKENSAKQIWLAILYDAYKENPNKLVDKNEISRIVIQLKPNLGTDQQVRHLKRDGWDLITEKGGHHRINPYKPATNFMYDLKRHEKLIPASNFEEIKKVYNGQCLTCGAKEGEKSWRYNEKVRLEQGHRDPDKPITKDNIIPQCQFCNKAYKGDFTFDERGRVRAVASVDPVKRASEKVQKSIWKFLKSKFKTDEQ